MRAILVGPPQARERLRQDLVSRAIDVVGEFATAAEARAADLVYDILVTARAPDRTINLDEQTVFDEPLTAREMQVLQLLAEGLPNRGIADRLGISDQTVKFHVASIMGKLGASNRVETVRRAASRGLITL